MDEIKGLDEPEPEVVTVNGHASTLDQLVAFSEYFRSLLKGAFSEAKERQFEMKIDGVPYQSEAWEYYIWHCNGSLVPNRKPEIRWLERLKVVSYLSVVELQDPPTWFLDDLNEVSDMEDPEYLLSLWETLKIIKKTGKLPAMLPLIPSESTAAFMWQDTTPRDLRQEWSHFYLDGPHGARASNVFPPPPNFWKNLETASAGLLPLQDWPEALIWSGGSVVDCMFSNTTERPGRDFDLWIWDEKQAGSTLKRVITELQRKRPDLMIWDKGSSVDLLFPGLDFHIQILTRGTLAPWMIPFKFDLDYVRAYVDRQKNLYVFPECLEAWQTRQISWWNPKCSLSTDRLEKAAQKGFKVPEMPVSREKAANLPWFHPHKGDTVEYVRTITQCIAPTSKLTQDPAEVQLPIAFPGFYEDDEGIEFKISETLLTEIRPLGDFATPPMSFRLIAEILPTDPLEQKNDYLNALVLNLNPVDYPAHRQFLLEVQKLETIGVAKWKDKFSASVGPSKPNKPKTTFALAKNRFGLVFNEEGQKLEKAELKNLSGMAEISFSLSGIWNRYDRPVNRRNPLCGFYFRFDRIQMLDHNTARRHLANYEPLKVEYFGPSSRVGEETKSPE